jgi:hypothetical protein
MAREVHGKEEKGHKLMALEADDVRLYWIKCDCLDDDEIRCSEMSDPELSHRDALRVARNHGWAEIRSYWYCPRHHKKFLKEAGK